VGAVVAPELDWASRPEPPRARSPQGGPAQSEIAIDLAFEPHSNAALPVAFAPTTEPHLGEESVRLPRAAGSVERLDDSRQEIEADAHLLADHGPAGGHWLGAAPYAWRVLRRQRELRRALQGRRQEAVRARGEQEDALVAFADRLRPVAAGLPDYIEAMDQLRRAEAVLRSRDRVLAAEMEAHAARLASVDTRIGKLGSERERLLDAERTAAAELATAQAELAREEAQLKRAEAELRSIRARAASRGRE